MVFNISLLPTVNIAFFGYGHSLSSINLVCFPDLQLDVKGCRDVYASFDKYVEVERLEGDNKYHAEQHGLQVGDTVKSAVMVYVNYLGLVLPSKNNMQCT